MMPTFVDPLSLSWVNGGNAVYDGFSPSGEIQRRFRW
jgi:hypothetical protein